jgi:hypothetical protein
MTRLIQFPTVNGGLVLIEVADGTGGLVTRGGAHGGSDERVADGLDERMAHVKAVATDV